MAGGKPIEDKGTEYELTEMDVNVLSKLNESIAMTQVAAGTYLGNILVNKYGLEPGKTFAFQIDFPNLKFVAHEVEDVQTEQAPPEPRAGDRKPKR